MKNFLLVGWYNKMGCNNSKIKNIERNIENIIQDNIAQFDILESKVNNLKNINNKLYKEIEILQQLNMIDTSVYQCWTGTLSGFIPGISKKCSIKLIIINGNYKTYNENKQWFDNDILDEKFIDGCINGVFHYNYNYKYRGMLDGACEELTNNPFIMMNNIEIQNLSKYKKGDNIILEIICDTNKHYKYFIHIINWLVEKNIWDQNGSNKKKEFVWTKSFVNV